MTANPPSSSSSVTHQSPDNFRVIRKRNRIPVSCGPCRHRKLKCNRQHPCENCVKRDDVASCNYASLAARNRRANTAGDKASPDDMQARIDRLEGLVLSLMGSGAPDRRGSKDSKEDDVDDDGSQMHTEETTSEGTNNDENDFIRSEVDDDVEDVRRYAERRPF
ncbi:hypothetical protein ABW21_db0202682 [Orbilia brochopaga]|nr:hypothetical protein ABW21_db0202682 [Drechslerella brochopaga]